MKMQMLLTGLVLLISFAVYGADLVLKDGRILRNYRIKEVKGNKVEIAYVAGDGAADVMFVDLQQLPDKIRSELGKLGQTDLKPLEPWQNGKSMSEKLRLALEHLKRDLALAAGDKTLRAQAANKMYRQLLFEIAKTAEEVDLQVIKSDSVGVLAKVTGVIKGSTLRSGEYVCLKHFKADYPHFRKKVYFTGGAAVYDKYGNVQIWCDSVVDAAAVAVDWLARSVGDDTLFAEYLGKNVDELPPDGGNTVIYNVFYNDDDNDKRVIYRYVPRYRRKGYRPNRPDRPVRPGKPLKPGKPDRPGKPDKPVRPNRFPDRIDSKPVTPVTPGMVDFRPAKPTIPVTRHPVHSR